LQESLNSLIYISYEVEVSIIPLAAKKIELRNISKDLIKETVTNPDQIVEGYGGRIVKQKIYSINNKKKLLRVVCEKSNKETIVITAYLTSQIKKYWRD